jgi:RNA polymerase-binding transcription factor DksA
MNTDTYKEVLTAEKGSLEAELAGVGRINPSNPNDWEAVPQEVGQEADPTDAADQMEGYSENHAILTDLEIRYQEVLAALDRIEKGTYGVCSIGGEPIEEERLRAQPAAATCRAHMGAG